MKICPACHTSYTDDSLNFCLKDGSALRLVTPTYETPTVVMDEQETIVRDGNNPLPPVTPRKDQGMSGGAAHPKNSNTVLTVLITVLIMLFLMVVGWLYLDKSKTEVAENSNRVPAPSPKTSVKPSPTPSGSNSNTSVNSSSDPDQVKSDVQKKLNLWKSLSEERDLESNLQNYADHVDYYLKKDATRDFIRNDKQKASSLYNSIKIELHNINIIPDPGGEKATVVLDKEWKLKGPGKSSSGKVQQQLKLEKIGGDWLITSEKDLKVYYTN